MPALSSTMTEGKIVSWVKSEGDKLSKGESVVVVESDKADMDVETFYDGYLAAIMVDEGGVAAVGSAIGLLAETEEEIQMAKDKASNNAGSSSAAAASPSAPVEAAVSDSAPKGEDCGFILFFGCFVDTCLIHCVCVYIHIYVRVLVQGAREEGKGLCIACLCV